MVEFLSEVASAWSFLCGKALNKLEYFNKYWVIQVIYFFWVSLAVCIFQRECLFYLRSQIYYHKVILIYPNFPFNICGMYDDIPSLNPNISTFHLLYFYPINLARALSIFIDIITGNHYDTEMASWFPYFLTITLVPISSVPILQRDGLSSRIKSKLKVTCKTPSDILQLLTL